MIPPDDLVAGRQWALELSAAMRGLLDTPMSDPTHRDVVIRARVVLMAYDTDMADVPAERREGVVA